MRHLVVVLGDQLNRDSSAFDDFDPAADRVWMAERKGESEHVWSHKARSALFLAAMRHFAAGLDADEVPLTYTRLADAGPDDLVELLASQLQDLKPRRLVMVRPGEHRLREGIKAVAKACSVDYVERPDRHFLVSTDDFGQWAKGKTQLRMELFYRWMRQRHAILLDDNGQPVGGKWNYDSDNRGSFGRQGPGWVPRPLAFAPDAMTQEAIDDVASTFPAHPGELGAFDWPVTRDQAQDALLDFLDNRLPAFGHWQDAMWTGETWLYHARLSTCMNLRLLSPMEVIEGALERFKEGKVSLSSIEGFIRQILGWREFVIQRLMVTGNFALLLGVTPTLIHEWYLAIYVDAVEWVEAPNTLGMSQFADGGRMVSKPYAASGRYIDRMSNYCTGCRYKPGDAVGDAACPFTTLYWDFLERHRARFWHHPRAALQWRSLERLSADQIEAIQEQARRLRAQWATR